MSVFKYSLAKRGKTICPNCNKKTFVLYLETESGKEMYGFGRCDRESNCGFHKKPESNDVIFVPKYEVVIKETNYISLEVLEHHFLEYNNNNFS